MTRLGGTEWDQIIRWSSGFEKAGRYKAKTTAIDGLGRNSIDWQDSTHLRSRRSQGPKTSVLHDPGKQVSALGPTLFWRGDVDLSTDGAPSYRSEETEEWVARNFSDFVSVDLNPQRPGHWPTNSSDFDPLDYPIWGILESIACAKPRSTVEALKRDLTKASNNLPMGVIARAVDDFPK
ncbi:hypothetical protein ANCDUO_13221 [Ancylostoma duodenale]|uniref:Uncharacterized protein n=1 Tax=Ancylostoma duodenale TaxID=51022 RepID=A0A0C2CJH3_9BILA|nr:hypothetical protein ANCDUO_13221 [Ancylostoma duodenale]